MVWLPQHVPLELNGYNGNCLEGTLPARLSKSNFIGFFNAIARNGFHTLNQNYVYAVLEQACDFVDLFI